MSGDLFKAVPSGRIVTLCGPSGCGKSFLACSMCREAQKMGYTPIYMDSEGAIDSTFVKRLGVDPSKLIIKQVQTIFETSQFIAKASLPFSIISVFTFSNFSSSKPSNATLAPFSA